MYLIPVEVKESAIEGKGVFTVEAIKNGTIVWKYVAGHDQSLSPKDYEILDEAGKQYMEKVAYLSASSGQYIFPPENDPALYTNHNAPHNNLTVVLDENISREPHFVANHDIAAGEELTNNYHEFDAAINLKTTRPEWL
jgi:SET domain-containing protein